MTIFARWRARHSDRWVSWPILRRLTVDYMHPYRRRIYLSIALMIIGAPFTAAQAWFIQPILDDVFLSKNTAMLIFLPIAIIVLGLLKSSISYAQTILNTSIGMRFNRDIQMRLFQRMMQSDLAFFQHYHSGRVISIFVHDIIQLQKSLIDTISNLTKDGLSLIFLVSLMFYQDWQLSLILLVFFPLVPLPILRISRWLNKLAHRRQSLFSDFVAFLDGVFQSIRDVIIYGTAQKESARMHNHISALMRNTMQWTRREALIRPVMELFVTLFVASIVILGGMQVIHGTVTQGEFFSFLAAFLLAYKPFRVVVTFQAHIQSTIAAAQKILNIIDAQPSVRNQPGAKILKPHQPEIAFRGVSFTYQGAKDHALRKMNITIAAGRTTALVGPSGAGKSTVLNLIARFYDPQEGVVTIDRTDIRNVTLESLHSHMAIVSQDICLFDESIAANIAYGNDGADINSIRKAATLAHADSFIRDLPQGYDTLIGERGTRLSGGQRQRIAIARAFLRQAPMILLDEPTSSLDPISEQYIRDALLTLCKNRTCLIIAHRLSTIQNADCIHVLDQGRCVESGTHAALLLKKGFYASLYAGHHFDSEASST